MSARALEIKCCSNILWIESCCCLKEKEEEEEKSGEMNGGSEIFERMRRIVQKKKEDTHTHSVEEVCEMCVCPFVLSF